MEIGRNREKRAWGTASHSTKCIMVACPPRGVAVQTENDPPRPIVTAAIKKAQNHGYEQGYKEGSSLKVDLFQAGYDEGQHDEQGDWIIEGHGQHCSFQPTIVREDLSIQMDDLPPHSTATVAIQVDTPKSTPPLHVAVQANIPRTISFSTQDANSQTMLQPTPIPDPIQLPPPTSLNWADDAMALPISSLPIPMPPILSSHAVPCNLSILCSSSSKPFSSLQRHNKWLQPYFSQPFHNRQSFSIPYQTFSHYHFAMNRHPHVKL